MLENTKLIFLYDDIRMHYDGETSLTHIVVGNYRDDLVEHEIHLPTCFLLESAHSSSSETYYKDIVKILTIYLDVMKNNNWEIQERFLSILNNRGYVYDIKYRYIN